MTEREIDALIAEKVMGCLNVKQVTWFEGDELRVRIYELPRYSTSMADAWTVVEKMKFFEKNYWMQLWFADGQWMIGEYESFSFLGDRDPSLVTADTAPMCICLAALRAVGAIE